MAYFFFIESVTVPVCNEHLTSRNKSYEDHRRFLPLTSYPATSSLPSFHPAGQTPTSLYHFIPPKRPNGSILQIDVIFPSSDSLESTLSNLDTRFAKGKLALSDVYEQLSNRSTSQQEKFVFTPLLLPTLQYCSRSIN